MPIMEELLGSTQKMRCASCATAGRRWVLRQSQVSKSSELVAISTPVAAADGRVSRKTPVFQLPVYTVRLATTTCSLVGGGGVVAGAASKQTDGALDQHEQQQQFLCDLADLTDLIDKLKSLEHRWSQRTSRK